MADFFGLRLSCLDYQQGGFQGNPSPCWACLYEMISSNASDETASCSEFDSYSQEVSTRVE